MKSKSHRYLFLSPFGRQWVTRVTGQLTDGSRGSWVIKYDPLSALDPIPDVRFLQFRQNVEVG